MDWRSTRKEGRKRKEEEERKREEENKRWWRESRWEHIQRREGRLERPEQRGRREDAERRFKDVLGESQSRCYELVKEYDDVLVRGWKEEVDTLFALAPVRARARAMID